MCGVAGSYNFSNITIMKNMLKKTKHRGPDDTSFFITDNAMLGINRLSIMDIELGKQPMFSNEKNFSLVFNGEIFNYLEIKNDLKKRGVRFKTKSSDTEVILKAYEIFGLNCFKKFNGMFSIAIYEKKKDRLILVRDRSGIKPLFYSIVQNKIFFASEIKALFEVPLIKKIPNIDSFNSFFSLKNIPAPETSFKNIYQMNAAEILIFDKYGLKKKKFWEVKANKINSNSLDTNAKNIFNILNDSVKIRMRSDVEVGAFLSGGLDSSAVCHLANKYSKKKLKTFTLTYDSKYSKKIDDRNFARIISKRLNTEHHELEINTKKVLNELDESLHAFDQPFGGVISSYYLSKYTSKYVKTCLSGDGADELFGSYKFPRLIASNYSNSKIGNLSLSKIKDDTLNFNSKERIHLINKLNKNLNLKNIKYYKKVLDSHNCDDLLNKSLLLDFKTLLTDQVLSFVDIHSMAHSLEVRPPFLDNRLIDLSFKIPGSQKIKDGIVKKVLKKSLEKILPQNLIYRKKEGFVMPIEEIFIKKNKQLIKSKLSKKKLNNHNFLNFNYIDSLVKNIDTNNFSNNNKLWIIYCFQLWWDKHF